LDNTVRVRYMVQDVPASLEFYTSQLGFSAEGPQSPAFAAVRRGNLLLLLSGDQSSAGRPMPDGRKPEPGGWNRIHLVDDVEPRLRSLRRRCPLPNDIVRSGQPRRSSMTLRATRSSCSSPRIFRARFWRTSASVEGGARRDGGRNEDNPGI
jgi:catechol 2,3-dioxygenase-like lactoylglutathione lyase family enzyme